MSGQDRAGAAWLRDSIMRTRVTAQGRVGGTHHLGEEKQGNDHYTIGPHSEPVLEVRPGDRIVV